MAMAAATVMVVEDDASIRDLVIEVLGSEGLTAVGVENGAEALHRLRRDPVRPALILLDLMMPVMDGWQFRADPALARIPVVLMSALQNEECARVAAEDQVTKPFDLDVLVDTVARFASKGTPPPAP